MDQAREEIIIDSFIVPAKRGRYKMLLAKRRPEFLDALNHMRDFDDRHAVEVSTKDDVVALLRDRGAPERCYVISDEAERDGTESSLEEAIGAAEAGLWGTLACCKPGRLAYYRGEGGEQRLILHRDT